MIMPQVWQTPTKPPDPPAYIEFIKPVAQPQFPNRNKEHLEAVAYDATQARLRAEAELAEKLSAQQAQAVYVAPVVVQIGTLTGSYGYAHPGGNCILEVPANLRPFGNPITWAVTTQIPYIGAVALFRFNHVAIVTGIWSNGDIEVRHQNYYGGQHRFPRSAFRGFR